VGFNLLGIDPMKALYWTAVINGLLAPPLMVMTLLIARNPRIMGRLVLPRGLAALAGRHAGDERGGVAFLAS
jgi:Mn2+/Fe2+ NRAMP family transporter